MTVTGKSPVKSIRIVGLVIVFILLSLFVVSSLGSYLRSTKYDSQIAIQASYLNYYCGELCIALKVETVSNDELSGIIGLPVFPYKDNENIENYIAENLEHNQGLFCLKGNLHKWNRGFLRLFIVGSEGYPMEISSIEKLQPGQDCDIG